MYTTVITTDKVWKVLGNVRESLRCFFVVLLIIRMSLCHIGLSIKNTQQLIKVNCTFPDILKALKLIFRYIYHMFQLLKTTKAILLPILLLNTQMCTHNVT